MHPSTRRRHYLMCPPTYFGVQYAINPWMDPGAVVDTRRAVQQWERLLAVHRKLGHTVHVMEPRPGLPDMVFTANAATIVDGTVLVSRFKYPQRAPEAAHFRRWFTQHPYRRVRTATRVNEGQGDVLTAGRMLLAGTGFRTERSAHNELRTVLGLPVVTLTLVDPRFYHLDTALAVLSDDQVMYYPAAFDTPSRATLSALFPDALQATGEEAEEFALNAVCDGHHVVLPGTAGRLADELAARGFDPIGVDVSEFRKAGGGAKCCTLELDQEPS
ncbi:dimethylargininase [Kitasatospora sp. NPDC101801]|uniref:dimethylargininase n=1 Tax=Kitasatospora sp. NPDC101801 TaxID=3364103 RepID=UPI00380F74D3